MVKSMVAGSQAGMGLEQQLSAYPLILKKEGGREGKRGNERRREGEVGEGKGLH